MFYLIRVCLLLLGFVCEAFTNGIGASSKRTETTCECGKTNRQSYNRIIGGEEAMPHEYPFVVLISKRKEFWCGGSIITARHILTAAHCMQSKRPSVYDVSVAVHNWREPTRHQKTYLIEKIYIHPDYVNVEQNDISILLLKKEIKFNKYVGRICLPTGPLDIENKYVRVMGWGQDFKLFEHYSESLRHITVKVLSFKQCARVWNPSISEKYPRHLCTLARGKGACLSDSGGPIIWLDPDTNRYVEVALNSYGKDTECASEIPEVGTRISTHLNWIKTTINASAPLPFCTKKL